MFGSPIAPRSSTPRWCMRLVLRPASVVAHALDWSNLLGKLGSDAQRLKVLFISVDSERDTPDALKRPMPPTAPLRLSAAAPQSVADGEALGLSFPSREHLLPV